MTWFKVDDGLHSSSKHRKVGLAATGLWVLAGAWCADKLTDGFIPTHIVMTLGKNSMRCARVLSENGLWCESLDSNGTPGFKFHDWSQYQPSKEQVLDDRRKAAERQKRHRKKQAEVAAVDDPSQRDDPRDDSTRHGVTHGVSHATPDPTSTRTSQSQSQVHLLTADAASDPDTSTLFDDPEVLPPPPRPATVRRTAKPPAGEDPDFVRFWEIYPRIKNKGQARTAWKKALKTGVDPEIIIEGAKHYANERSGQDPTFTAYPGSWLNAEGWTNEPDSPQQRWTPELDSPWRA